MSYHADFIDGVHILAHFVLSWTCCGINDNFVYITACSQALSDDSVTLASNLGFVQIDRVHPCNVHFYRPSCIW